MKKKLLASIILGAVIIYGALTWMFLSKAAVTELIVCSLDEGVVYIPKSVCSTYLLNYRDTEEDIKVLNANGGLHYILAGYQRKVQTQTNLKSNSEYLSRMLNITDAYLAKGLNVNQISLITGLTPLHAEILANNPVLVEYLLGKGADIHLKDNRFQLNAVEFTELLIAKNPQVDRTAISQLLKGNIK